MKKINQIKQYKQRHKVDTSVVHMPIGGITVDLVHI